MATRMIEPLRLNEGQEATIRWLRRFEALCTLNEYTSERRVSALLTFIGEECFKVISEALAPDNPLDKSFEIISDVLTTHVYQEKLA